MDVKTETWLTELLAALIISVFVSVAAYRWLIGEISGQIMIVFVVTVLTALGVLFGVDRVKAVFDLWTGRDA